MLARLAAHEVEVTNTRQYPQWRRERWGIDADTRQNESTKFLTPQTVGEEDLAYLRNISVEDAKLYLAVEQHLQRTGACAVTDWAAVALEEAAVSAVAA